MIAAFRSILFYIAFYPLTVGLVIVAVGSAMIGGAGLFSIVRFWTVWHRACMRLAGIRVRVEGKLADGPALYAIKHESFFEALELPHYLPRPVVFAKAELFKIPAWGRAARYYGLIPVEREQGATALRAMGKAARKFAQTGRPLAIFPEGTRVAHGQRPPLRSGFAGLYKIAGLPVVPVAVNSGPLYHRLWKQPGTITLRIGEPIPPGLSRAEIEARVHAAINELND